MMDVSACVSSAAHDMTKSDWNGPPAVRAKRNKSHTVVADISWKPYCPEKNSVGSQEAMSLVPQQTRHVTNTGALSDADKRMIHILQHAVYSIRQKTDDLVGASLYFYFCSVNSLFDEYELHLKF